MSGDSWITWAEAAELVGCPVPTIEWYVRQGRIERRPFKGSRPSLSLASVDEFGFWWAHEQAARAERRAQPLKRRQRKGSEPLPPPKPPDGWLSTRDAASELGMSSGHIGWLIRHGQLIGVKHGHRLWVEPGSVKRLAANRARWISLVEASALADCSTSLVADAVQRGELSSRRLGRAYPSLERSAVVTWAQRRRVRLADVEQRRLTREHTRELAGRPDLDHEWIDRAAVATLLDISHSRVDQLARAERLPSVMAGRRRWFRRDHIQQVARARRFEQRFS